MIAAAASNSIFASSTMTPQASGSIGFASTTAGSALMMPAPRKPPAAIEPTPVAVLDQVAQDVGELQRAAEVMSNRNGGVVVVPNTCTDRRPTALATRSQ